MTPQRLELIKKGAIEATNEFTEAWDDWRKAWLAERAASARAGAFLCARDAWGEAVEAAEAELESQAETLFAVASAESCAAKKL